MSLPWDDLGTEGAGPAGPVSDEASPKPGSGDTSSSPPPGSAAAADDGSREVEADFEKLLQDAQDQRDEYLELARRTKADFENYRKRVAQDVQAALARGKAEVARDVIEAVDNLERALAAGGEGESLAAGVEMVLGGLRETLKRNGIESVDPKGEKFDPNHHEALSTQPADGTEPGVVIEVLQKGYTLGDHLIRPARVVVSA